MAQTVWFNVSLSTTGKHTLGPSGDLQGGDLTVSFDGTKMTPANTSLEGVMAIIKLGLMGRGFK
jgi:hypothetical protein